MALQNRSSVFAPIVESTEGTPVAPSNTTDYIPLQDDFTITTDFATLANPDLLNSLGTAKSVQGLESPTASGSILLKHSGTEGTAPQTTELWEALVGTVTANGTERATTTGSTVSVVNLAAGGSDFARGYAILVKDSTNGHSIRPVHSVATNALTLGFNLANAPASGVSVGKCVHYEPINSAHQTLTLWQYVANGGAIQMIAGARPTNCTVNITAGEIINTSWSFQGIEAYFNPVTIDANDIYVDWTDDDGTFAASITADTYKSPHEVATALTTAMNATATTVTHTVTYSDTTGKFTFSQDGSTFSLLWNTGSNAANTIGDAIGFSVAANDTGSTSYVGDNALSYASPQTPAYTNLDVNALVAKNMEILIGDADDVVCFKASEASLSIDLTATDVLSVCAASGKSGTVPTTRAVTMTASALLDQYDASKWTKFINNGDVRACINAGSKTGGNWDAGKCVSFYLPTTTITSHSLSNADSLVQLDLELQAYVDTSGNGEIYVNFL